MPYEFFYNSKLETHVALSDTGHTVMLEIDEMDALRVFALREHLDDFDSKMELDGTTVIVAPYQQADGISPDEARRQVAWVRECLAKVKSIHTNALEPATSLPELHTWSLSDLRKAGYNSITYALQRDCPDEVAKGPNDLVNLVYTLVSRKGSYAREINYIETLREAWAGGDVHDCRTWSTANLGEYRVLTDDEADDAWDEELERYIDDCLEIPESVEPYFDREKWKADARRDGRGHSLSSYDGCENQVEFNGLDDMTAVFYIYRTN